LQRGDKEVEIIEKQIKEQEREELSVEE